MKLIRLQSQPAEVPAALAPGELLRDFMNLHFPFFPTERAGMNVWSPSLDVYDDKDAFVVALEVAGLRKEDFEISFHDGVLSIAGERKAEESKEGSTCFRRERFYGRFSRSVAIPAAVQSDKITAAYKDGVLTVTLPKAEEAKPKQIAVDLQ